MSRIFALDKTITFRGTFYVSVHDAYEPAKGDALAKYEEHIDTRHLEFDDEEHTWREITDAGYLKNLREGKWFRVADLGRETTPPGMEFPFKEIPGQLLLPFEVAS